MTQVRKKMRMHKKNIFLSYALLVLAFICSFSVYAQQTDYEKAQGSSAVQTIADKSVSLSKSSLEMGVYESFTLTVKKAAAKEKYTFSSTDSSVTIVSSKGKITALKKGTAVICVKGSLGYYGECTVNVLDAPESISLTRSKLTIGVGESFRFNTAVPENSASASVKLYVSDSQVLENCGGNTVRALKEGKVKVTVKTYNGKKAVCEVTVLAAPKKVTISREKLSLGVDEVFDFTSKTPKGSASHRRIYTSSDDSVLVYEGSGEFRALKKGTVTVTVETYNGKKDSCEVRVLSAPSQLKLNKTELYLGKAESFIFKPSVNKGGAAESVRYTCSDTSILRVRASGAVRALKEGTVTLTAETYNGKKATCKITVKAAPRSVTLNKSEIKLGVGESFDFDSKVSKGSASYLRSFTCSDGGVLSHSGSGVFKALKKGTATVTVETYNGKKAHCRVTVLPAPESVTLNKTKLTLGIGESFDFDSYASKGTASYIRKYYVSDASVLSLGDSGVVTALRAGKATVTVKTFNGKKAKCSVTVLPMATEIYSDKSSYSLAIGSSTKALISFPKGTGCGVLTYKSSNSSVAYCDKNGYIIARKMGTATVSAVLPNGKSCSFTVYVKGMGVPFVSQLPLYPTGCEAASCASLLRYYGYSITLDQMVDAIPRMSIYVKDGKRWGPDINEYFVGNPRGGYTSADPGYGAFSPCVTKSLQRAIDERGGKHKAVMLTGCSFSELLSEISQGRPAIVWATYMMQIPKTVNSWYIIGTGKYFEYPRGTHVMVVNGYSDGRIYIVDPYKGQVDFSISIFEDRWELLGRQAIVIR